MFKVDISTDSEKTHPKKICKLCKRKFDRYNSSSVKLVAHGSIAEFKEHSNDKCQVCTVSTIKKKAFSLNSSHLPKASVWLTKTLVTKKCREYGFHDMSADSDCQEGHFCLTKIVHKDKVPVCQFNLFVSTDGSWTINIYNRKIEFIPFEIPEILTADSFDHLLSTVTTAKVCVGNPDFELLINRKTSLANYEEFKDKKGGKVTVLENDQLEQVSNASTIRHVNCQIIISENDVRCEVCTNYRKTLNTLSWRLQKKTDDSGYHKNTGNAFLSRDNLEKKASYLAKEVKSLLRSVARLQSLVHGIIDKEGEMIPEKLHEICKNTIEKEKIEFPKDSPQYLLWEQQCKQSAYKDNKSMKWHPVMIRWCISIYLKSPGAYEQLRNSGFLKFPHKKTLLQYTNYTEPKCGINIDVIKNLLKEIDSYSDLQQNVGLIFDEIKIKSGLVYSRQTNQIVGFCDMGDMNNELDDFKRHVEKGTEEKSLSSYVLTFMVRGIFTSLAYPFAYYAGQGFTSDQLYPCVWECVRALECINLKVLFFTSDGAAPNRRFYRLHLMPDGANKSDDGVTYWCWNRYASEQRKLYFFCDVPHLVKTVRNNIENSHGHLNTRNLMVCLILFLGLVHSNMSFSILRCSFDSHLILKV